MNKFQLAFLAIVGSLSAALKANPVVIEPTQNTRYEVSGINPDEPEFICRALDGQSMETKPGGLNTLPIDETYTPLVLRAVGWDKAIGGDSLELRQENTKAHAAGAGAGTTDVPQAHSQQQQRTVGGGTTGG